MEVYHAQTRLESRTGTISTNRTTRTNHRELWSGKEVTFKGKYYQTKKAKLYTPPASPIPIYVSTLVPESANFAGKYGDGLITVGGKQPDLYKQLFKSFENTAKEAGKKPSDMPRLIEWRRDYRDSELSR